MQIVVAGSHGLIGSALVDRLRSEGHDVRRLVRRAPRARDELAWDPDGGRLDPRDLAGTDALVNVAGAGIGDHRWTRSYKRTLVESRTRTTGLLARTLARMDEPPPVWVQASGVGVVGDRGAQTVTETSSPGTGFIADLVQRWEECTAPAGDAGVRVVHSRFGIVLAPDGGALGRLLPLVRLGLGGRLGPGTQYWSWVTLHDAIEAIRHLIASSVHGPVNVVAPHPATNAEVTRALAREVHRPAVLAVPAFALRAVLGELSSEVLSSQRALPTVLEASGFRFAHPTIEDAARWVVGGGPRPGH